MCARLSKILRGKTIVDKALVMLVGIISPGLRGREVFFLQILSMMVMMDGWNRAK